MASVQSPKDQMSKSPEISQSDQAILFDMMAWLLAMSCLASGTSSAAGWDQHLPFITTGSSHKVSLYLIHDIQYQ